MKSLKTVLLVIFIVISNVSESKEFLAQGRIFLGQTYIDPIDVNESIESQGLNKLEGVNNFGAEITVPVAKYFEVGARYTKRTFGADEDPSNESTTYKLDGNQDSILFLARFVLTRSSFFRSDVFAGVGGSNTSFKITTASQDGEFTRRESKDWYATPYAAAGASVGFGLKGVYFYVEGGVEKNNVDSFKHTGNVDNSIKELDLSGSYVLIGLMLDGVRARSK